MPATSSAKRRAPRAAKTDGAKLPPSIRLRHRQSGKEKRVATGFAWDLFLFAGIFGVPLFWRRLHSWGAVILALWCVDLVLGRLPVRAETTRLAEAVLFAVFLALQLFLGFWGNRLTARSYLAHGWIIEDPAELGTKRVLERWRLTGREMRA